MAAWQSIHSLVTCISTVVGDFYPSKKWSEFGICVLQTFATRNHPVQKTPLSLVLCRSLDSLPVPCSKLNFWKDIRSLQVLLVGLHHVQSQSWMVFSTPREKYKHVHLYWWQNIKVKNHATFLPVVCAMVKTWHIVWQPYGVWSGILMLGKNY